LRPGKSQQKKKKNSPETIKNKLYNASAAEKKKQKKQGDSMPVNRNNNLPGLSISHYFIRESTSIIVPNKIK